MRLPTLWRRPFLTVLLGAIVGVLSATTSFAAPFPGTLTWQLRATMPTDVYGSAGGVIGTHLYVSHGVRLGFDSSDLDIYDITTDTWGNEGTIPIAAEPRSAVAGAVAGGRFYAIGGNGPTATVEAYDPGIGDWLAGPLSSLSVARAGLGAASLGGLIYAVGGRDGTGPGTGTIFDTTEFYDPSTDIWTTLSSMPLAVSDPAGTVALNGKMYVIGGALAPGSVTNAVQIYDPTSDTWSVGADASSARASAMAGVLCGQLVVFGGRDGSGNLLVATEIYDPGDDTWSAGPDMPEAVAGMAQGPAQTETTIFSAGSVPSVEGASSILQALVATCASPSPTSAATPTAADTGTPVATPTPDATATPVVTATPSATATPEPTATPTPSPTPVETATATSTATPSATPMGTATVTATPLPTATETATPEPTNTATPVPTATITATPAATATATATPQPTRTATVTATATTTATVTPTATPTSTPTATATPVCTITGVTISNVSWNSFKIPAGTSPVVWLNAHIGTPSGIATNKKSTVLFTGGVFTVNGTPYPLPDGLLTFDPAAPSTITTNFNAAMNRWETLINPSHLSDEIFFNGAAIPVTPALAAGGKATWSMTVTSDAPNFSLSWQTSAAAYTYWPTDSNDAQILAYHGSNHAGTPLNKTVQNSLIQGPRGGGGSNFTGSWSATGAARCP